MYASQLYLLGFEIDLSPPRLVPLKLSFCISDWTISIAQVVSKLVQAIRVIIGKRFKKVRETQIDDRDNCDRTDCQLFYLGNRGGRNLFQATV